MSDDRPPLAAFDDEIVERVAGRADVDSAELRELVERHQQAVRDLPGVEDIVYEWRSQFHEDPLVHRSEGVYVLVHRPHVWEEYDEALDLTAEEADVLRAVHDQQAREVVADGDVERVAAGAAMVLTRP